MGAKCEGGMEMGRTGIVPEGSKGSRRKRSKTAGSEKTGSYRRKDTICAGAFMVFMASSAF